MMIRWLLSFFVLLTLTQCATPPAPKPDKIYLKQVSFDKLENWNTDRIDQAWPALVSSCERIIKSKKLAKEPGHLLNPSPEWVKSCQAVLNLKNPSHNDVRHFLETHFTPYQMYNNDTEIGLFTGYYEPELKGAQKRQGAYQHALYKMPKNKTSIPREEIISGGLEGQNLELVYVDDPIDLFFLHIQGSGLVRFENGHVERYGFDGHNNQTYFAIGKALVDQGEIAKADISMQSIKAWLRTHPERADEIMNLNPAFVFFKHSKEKGPKGAQQVVLTPERSLAVDPAYIPYGAPLWLETSDPIEGTPYTRLMIAQDTGSAIKGPLRGDVFWGAGEEAEEKAGLMKQTGRYFILLPKGLQVKPEHLL